MTEKGVETTGTENRKRESFYRMPKALFTDGKYAVLPSDAKLLYTILLDRACLSDKNGWKDEGGTFIYFTQAEVCQLLRMGSDKVCRLFSALEKAGLIRRKKQGQGRASKIYVMGFPEFAVSEYRTSENADSCNPESGSPDFGFSEGSNTEKNNTDFNYTYLSISGYDRDEMEEQIKDNIDYEILAEKGNRKTLDELVMLMVDVICGTGQTVRLGGSTYSRETVRSQFLSLGPEHIEYVMERLRSTTSDIRNIRAYMLTALYNAPATIDSYYQAKVQHDMPEFAY